MSNQKDQLNLCEVMIKEAEILRAKVERDKAFFIAAEYNDVETLFTGNKADFEALGKRTAALTKSLLQRAEKAEAKVAELQRMLGAYVAETTKTFCRDLAINDLVTKKEQAEAKLAAMQKVVDVAVAYFNEYGDQMMQPHQKDGTHNSEQKFVKVMSVFVKEK